MKRKSKKKIFGKTIQYIILIAVAALMIFPLIYAFLSAFKTNLELMAYPEHLFPEKFMFSNILKIFNSEEIDVKVGFFNSLWFTCANVVVSLFLSAVCGYVFARGDFKLKKPLFTVFTALMFISMGSITIYPMLKIVSFFGLQKSLLGLLVTRCFGIPVVEMHIVKSFVDTLPKSLDESAKIEGCTFIDIFFKIIAPMLKPTLATLAILAFKSSWNEYVTPAIYTMSSPKQQTLMVMIMALKNSGQGASDWTVLFMASIIMIIPVLVIFVLFNKQITDSVTEGAIKG